jgi:hypothetical protein
MKSQNKEKTDKKRKTDNAKGKTDNAKKSN